MNIRPLSTKIVVQLIEKEKTSPGGIILTKADASEVNKGLVLAIGPDVEDIEVGDIILPNWNAARKTTTDDEDVYIVQEDDVVLVFED
jgi:chaperonin GroES